MGRQVLLFAMQEPAVALWARQWKQASPHNRVAIGMPSGISDAAARHYIEDARRRAGADGSLIFHVGHGGVANNGHSTVAQVQLAPAFVGQHAPFILPDDPLYDVPTGGQPRSLMARDRDAVADLRRLHHPRTRAQLMSGVTPGREADFVRQIEATGVAAAARLHHYESFYLPMTAAMRGVKEVVFVTCQVGQAGQWLHALAADIHAHVVGFQGYIAIDVVDGHARTFFADDAPGTGTNTSRGETELPGVRRYDAEPREPHPEPEHDTHPAAHKKEGTADDGGPAPLPDDTVGSPPSEAGLPGPPQEAGLRDVGFTGGSATADIQPIILPDDRAGTLPQTADPSALPPDDRPPGTALPDDGTGTLPPTDLDQQTLAHRWTPEGKEPLDAHKPGHGTDLKEPVRTKPLPDDTTGDPHAAGTRHPDSNADLAAVPDTD